ncbi:MAG: 50S ribosomal protein L9 [Endomicrobium sp.]|jgi:large subunit ribosomal protein L9|nr:50S ribosomal protein L9 [Endomicrobium sp.]
MRIILRSDITNVGRQGEVKEVSPGYARNYLIPQNFAMEATSENLKVWERERAKLEKQREDIISAMKEVASKMEKVEFHAKVKIGENGKIFGSITAANISKIFEDNGFKVNKRNVLLAENIKGLGDYEINVRLHPEVTAKVKFSVVT